jgi:hypothetical protein
MSDITRNRIDGVTLAGGATIAAYVLCFMAMILSYTSPF